MSHRESVRRIGSGRILTRDIWDFRPENEKLEPAFRPGASGGASIRDRDNRDTRDGKDRENVRDRDRERDNLRDRDDRNERFERRSFGRDYRERDRERERERDRERGVERNDRNHRSDRDKDRGRERRFSNDRRRTYSENRNDADEPEWFISGPTSQHDTIELRGFEDIPEEKAVNNNNSSNSSSKSKKQTPVQKKRGKKNSLEKDEKQNENSAGPKGRSTPTAMDQPINVVAAPHSPISEQHESVTQKANHDSNESAVTEQSCDTAATDNSSTVNQNQEDSHPDFNLDEFLKSDTLPGVPGLLTVSKLRVS